MKAISIFVMAAVFAVPSLAQNDMKGHDMKSMEMKQQATKAEKKESAHKATGTVKKIDAARNRVTIAHGPVESLKWPGMTMGFVVKEKALMDKMAVDKKIDFEFVQQGRDYVVTSVK